MLKDRFTCELMTQKEILERNDIDEKSQNVCGYINLLEAIKKCEEFKAKPDEEVEDI